MALSRGRTSPLRPLGRRAFLQAALSTLAGSTPRMAGARERTRPVLVCLELMGGLDGMSLLVPYGEDAYYRARPELAVPPPGRRGGALPLTDGFGLHPTLEPLYQLFLEGTLSIVPAAGDPELSRSHFQARELMYAAAPGSSHASLPDDGWANRFAQTRGEGDAAARLFSTTPGLPPALAGSARVQSSSRPRLLEGDESTLAHLTALQRMYRGNGDPFARSAEQALRTAAEMQEKTRRVRLRGSYDKRSRALGDAVRLIHADVGAEVIWIEVGGFDTHKSQGGTQGHLAKKLAELGRGLASFRSDLGRKFDDVVLVTLTEFGRTLRETGAKGTDHGSASCMLVLGGRVQGGQLVGRWPGLDSQALRDGRDLAVTTHYKSVLGEVLTSHMGLERAGLAEVLPDFDFDAAPPLGLFKP